jgi:hypothetical protein
MNTAPEAYTTKLFTAVFKKKLEFCHFQLNLTLAGKAGANPNGTLTGLSIGAKVGSALLASIELAK